MWSHTKGFLRPDVVQYDHTVRDYNNRIIQFRYNVSGLDPKWQVATPKHGMQFADVPAMLTTWSQRTN